MTDSPFFTQLKAMGFDGTGYKYKQNDLIGGYVFICLLNGKWTEIDFERGEIFTNKTFENEVEARDYIADLLGTDRIEYFDSSAEMFK